MQNPAPGPSTVPSATPKTDTKSLLALHIAIVTIVSLYFAREIFIPIALAVLLSFVLSPVADRLRSWGLWRVPSVLISAVLAVCIILAVGAVIGTQIAQLARNAPQYSETIERKVASARNLAVNKMAWVTTRLGIGNIGQGSEKGSSAAPATQQQAPKQSALAIAQHYLFPILSPLSTGGIVLVVAVFLLLQKEDLRDRLIRLFGSNDLYRTTMAMDDAAGRLSRYLLTQLGLNTAFGAVVGIGLFFIGIPNPLLWGILSACLRFVPYIGSFASAALPILLAAAVDPGWSTAIWTTLLYVAVELTVSQAIEPVLYGHSTGLSPFAVIVSAIFWSWLWGAIGLILSMPLTLCLVVLGRHFRQLRFLDVLLGDRAPLSPVESFYQRILAGDIDEAQEHAEELLQHTSLSSYYDEVTLKGIQLAARDSERGVISLAQLNQIKEDVLALIEELSDYEDLTPNRDGDKEIAGRRPEPRGVASSAPSSDEVAKHHIVSAWRRPGAIVCLAGRGPLDDAASAMLAQLLKKHGVGANVLPYRTASRDAIANMNVSDPQLVCISYLDISGQPAHLRYLLRRLRRRLPAAKILVGLWPVDDPATKDEAVRAAIGADYYTSSLAAAVETSLAEARRATNKPLEKGVPMPAS